MDASTPDERLLSRVLASQTDIRQAPDEEPIARTAARSAHLVAFLRVLGGSVMVSAGALALVYFSGVPVLSQRTPFVASVLVLVFASLLLIRLMSRRRRAIAQAQREEWGVL